MKTEFLKELGHEQEQEQIDKIMAEYGKDIAAEKIKTNLLRTYAGIILIQ